MLRKTLRNQRPFYTNLPKERLKQRNGRTMFEPVRRIENIDVFMKKLIRAATDLVESIQKNIFRSRGAISAISRV